MGSASIYRRRLQRIGHGSYLITLSRDWVEAHGLKKGSEIIIMDDGPSLRMFPADTLGQRTVQLQLKEREDPRELSIPLWTYYMQGADEVVVKSDGIISSDVKHSLRSLLLEMPGAFIVDEDAYTIRVKVSSDVVKLPTDGEVRKMVGFTIKVYEDSARAFMEGDGGLASEVVERGTGVNRWYRAVIRQISLWTRDPEVAVASGINDSRELIAYVLMVRDLSRIVYHSTHIARLASQLQSAPSDAILRSDFEGMSSVVEEMITTSTDMFLSRDVGRIHAVLRRMKRVRELEELIGVRTFETVRDLGTAVRLLMAANEFRRIAGYSVAISDDAANLVLVPGAPGRSAHARALSDPYIANIPNIYFISFRQGLYMGSGSREGDVSHGKGKGANV